MPLNNNLLAYWKLDNNGSGGVSLVDSTNNGYTLTNNNNVVTLFESIGITSTQENLFVEKKEECDQYIVENNLVDIINPVELPIEIPQEILINEAIVNEIENSITE